jgi:AcrR family transcriptional regulator
MNKLPTALKTGSRAAKKAAQPENILAAALQAFGEKGFSGTRMEDVAAKAGITKGAIYLYFPSKQALLEALARRDITPFLTGIATQVCAYDGPIEPMLRQVAGAALTFMDRGALPTYARVIVSEARNFPDIARFYLTEIVTVVLGALSDLFQRAMTRGEIRAMEPELAARLFMAPLIKTLFWRITFSAVETEPFDANAFLDAHVGVFLRGMKPDDGAPS